MAEYYNVTTNLGDAEIANAIATNTKLDITHVAFGDGNGSVPTPNKARTSLVREVHRQAVTKYERHATNANWIVIETIIPSSIGGFWVREMGIIANGKLISHGSHAPFEKVADPTGVSEYRLKFTQNIKDGNVVNITLDQSLIYASQAWTDENYVPRDEIIDNLTTDDATKPVSAKQAKKLQDNKLDKTANAASATKLATACSIGGVNFDGTANINLPGVNVAGNQSTSGNAASATKLQTARTIAISGAVTGSFNYDGSSNSSAILTLANSGVAANTYGGSFKIPVVTVNAKGLITGVSEQNIPIVDNLTTDDATKPVSAKQAKNLQDNKLGKTENASSSSLVINRGDIPALAGPGEVPLYGLTLSSVYDNGYPTKYGNVLHLGGIGQGEILVGWPGVNGGLSPSFIRSKRDNLNAPWSPWREIVLQDTMPYQLVGLAKKLENPRAINGVGFDGSTNITIYDASKLPLTGGTLTGPLTVNHPITVYMSDADGAFQKLIQGSTSTDGGYLAVGNTGQDRGFVEIGTTDDNDTEIYATQRDASSNILRRATLLDGVGNTLFPEHVYAKTFNGGLNGNSSTATKLKTPRNIALAGAVSGNVDFDGSGNVEIVTSPNTNSLRVVEGNGYTITYDDARRIAIVQMTLWTNKSVTSQTLYEKSTSNRHQIYSLPIMLKKRISADVQLSEEGATALYVNEAGEWLKYVMPDGYRSHDATSKLFTKFVRWSGSDDEPVSAIATVVGIF